MRIHWTFVLLLAWVAWQATGWAAALDGLVFTSLLFVMVLLHEFGHALAARRYGIRTPDITLLPIGGVARLERMPREPGAEVVVALAGPAVNVVLAAALYLLMGAPGGMELLTMLEADSMLARLFAVNVSLVAFNLIPAFPMDGGRVLRAGLSVAIERVRATRIAATVAKVFAVGFAAAAAYASPMLIVIAAFIWWAGNQEVRAVELLERLRAVPMRAVLNRWIAPVDARRTVLEAIDAAHHRGAHRVAVMGRDGLLGVIERYALIAAVHRGESHRPVAGLVASGGARVVSARATLDEAFSVMQAEGAASMAVVDAHGQVVGVLEREAIMAALHQRPRLARPTLAAWT